MVALLPLITAIIGQAPGVVSLILGLIHSDGSTTLQILTAAEMDDAAAMAAIGQLNAVIAAKNAAAKKV